MEFSYRWVIVAVGALMTCVGIGAMFSLAVYLEPMSVDTGWSRAGISSAMSIGMAFGPFAGGWIFDTFNRYSWLYLGSFGVALGAVAMALAFPRLTRVESQPA
jgi:MFS family permease